MRITTFIIFLTISAASFSQRNFTTGLHIGYNSSSFSGNDKPGKKLYSIAGLYLGGAFQYSLNNKLSIDADVALSTKGAKINTLSSIYENIYLFYLDIPIMAKINIISSHYFPVFISAGNSFGFNIGSFSTVGDMENVKTVDLSALIESGLKWKRISLSVRYSYGYTKFDKSDNHLDLRNSTLSVLAGFYFNK